MKKFKIGIDIHGVIDTMPEFFSFLTESIVKNGGECHILTGSSWSETSESKLREYGIVWTHKFSIYDYLMENDPNIIGEIQFPDGTIQKKFENDAWDSVKAKYCMDNEISLHIDDTLIYNDFFKTPFARFWSHNGIEKSSHRDIRHLDK